ncbi:MAG: NAD-dependent epimerase/dehydratase family protein [Promethearchaeota archaeon]
MEKTKVLLTGASGTVGIDIFKELLSRSDIYDIRLFLRASKKNKKRFIPYSTKVEIIWGSIENYEEVKIAVEDQDVVIHSAAVIPSASHYDPKIVNLVNVEGTRNIINSMLLQKKQTKIIYTSSIALYGDRIKNPNIKITDPVKITPGHPYAESKLAAEHLIQESGLDHIIFRLSYCTSTNMLKFRPVMFDMPLKTSVEIIDTRDVALALVNAIETHEIWGKTFNLGGGEKCQIEFGEHLDDMLEIMGFGRHFFPEEAFVKSDSHCGFYDTREIEEILKFQNHNLSDFYADVKKWIGFKRFLVPLVRPIIRWLLLKRSKYYKASKKK